MCEAFQQMVARHPQAVALRTAAGRGDHREQYAARVAPNRGGAGDTPP